MYAFLCLLCSKFSKSSSSSELQRPVVCFSANKVLQKVQNLNKNYSAAPVSERGREQDKLTVPGAVKGNTLGTKARLAQAIPGFMGKGVSLLSLPVFPCPGLAEQDRAFLALCWSHSPFVSLEASGTRG